MIFDQYNAGVGQQRKNEDFSAKEKEKYLLTEASVAEKKEMPSNLENLDLRNFQIPELTPSVEKKPKYLAKLNSVDLHKGRTYMDIEIDDNSDNKLTSTEIWNRFKKDNKEYVDENKLLIDDFKNYVKVFIDVDKYNEKSKKGSIEFVGFKFKEVLLVSQPIEIEINIPTVVQPKKKVVNRVVKNPQNLVINEIVDKEIVEHYTATEDDIMKISNDKNVQVWQIVSVLVNNKIITRRQDARGYEIYKETEEYKSKLNDSK
jgi:hypothetical protein